MKIKSKIFCTIMVAMCMSASFVYAEEAMCEGYPVPEFPSNNVITNNDNVITGKYDNIVKEYALQQANCFDNGVKFVADENASEVLNDYLSIQETTREIYLKKEKYTTVAEILEKEIIEDVIYYKVNIKANWVYEGSTDGSSYAKNVEVLVEKSTGKIIDFYDINSFTLAVRGEIDIRKPENRLTKALVVSSLENYKKKMSKTQVMIEESVNEINPEALAELHDTFASRYAYSQNSANKAIDCYGMSSYGGKDYTNDGFQYDCPAIYIDSHAIMYDSHNLSKPQTSVIVNGEKNEYTYKNYLYNSRTLVPAEVFELLGCHVEFDETTYVCTISGNNTVLEILPNLVSMRKNKEEGYWVPLEVCARFINNELHIPVRAVADQLGLYVGWNDETKTVTLDSAKPEGQDALKPMLYINRLPETVNCSLFELSGSVWDKENVAEVYVNNELVTSSKINEEKNWNINCNLDEGENKFNITVRSESGYEFTETKIVNYVKVASESKPKAPIFKSLECPERTNSFPVTIKGVISNAYHGVKLTINGHNIELNSEDNNVFYITLYDLNLGKNEYRFMLTNNHGQSTEVVKTITYIQK